ncbi:hypothetical protein [Mycobacterium angelicum]|uniref:hypothetical protein n=1 Tax=Mycobacterium angelicum TaxID=470074 RepID=UPI00111C0088|nr:hypothetical protein [Mycobacterium angelicum]MCV7198382.1 hypothetical protein [Mycobacterium angelicum]
MIDSEGHRLRIDYSEKLKEWPKWKQFGDWAAWIIERTVEGYYTVIRSVRHERAIERSENAVAVFASVADAGKYVILQIGDYLRSYLGPETLAIKWMATGLDPRIQVRQPTKDAIDQFTRFRPAGPESFSQQGLQKYTIQDDPSRFGFAFPREARDMQILALTYDELNALLLDGMPEDITSKISSH